MFKNILICSFVLKNNLHTIDTAFELAKKFDSSIIFLKCIHKELPTFAFFHRKSEKKKHEEATKEMQRELEEFEEMAKKKNISTKTEGVFVESLSESVISFVKKNNIDLFVVDSTPPSDITLHDHKDVVNRIYKDIDCAILTLK
jgi:hypothetical protein